MKSVSIEDLQNNPNLVGVNGEAVEITHNGERVGVIGGANAFPVWEWEKTGDEEYVDNGGATDPARAQQIRDAVENDYWRG